LLSARKAATNQGGNSQPKPATDSLGERRRRRYVIGAIENRHVRSLPRVVEKDDQLRVIAKPVLVTFIIGATWPTHSRAS
jgi:hypothetical protein